MPKPVLVACLASLGVSFLFSAVLTPFVRRWSLQRGFVDRPQSAGHKQHKQAVPFGGGIAITIAILVPLAVPLVAAILLRDVPADRFAGLTSWWPAWPYYLGGIMTKTPPALAVIAGALVMHLVGIIDDHRPLSPMLKLAIQIAVALLLTAGFGIRAATALGSALSILLSTLWIVAITNAFNFMDNMDGLSAGVAAICAVLLAVSALLAGQLFVPCVLLLIAGATSGFLVYNFPPASIFMGDAGSLVVGYLLSVCTVLTTFYDPARQREPFGVIVPLLIFAVPLYDMGSVVIYRLRSGSSIFRSDRRHFSHRLVRLGMGSTAAVLTIHLATAATALPAILLPLLNWAGALVILAQCACVVAIIAILETRNGS